MRKKLYFEIVGYLFQNNLVEFCWSTKYVGGSGSFSMTPYVMLDPNTSLFNGMNNCPG